LADCGDQQLGGGNLIDGSLPDTGKDVRLQSTNDFAEVAPCQLGAELGEPLPSNLLEALNL